MYVFSIHTHNWVAYIKSKSSKLSDDEFIRCEDEDWDEVFVNRNEILFYRIVRLKDLPYNNKEW